MTSRGRRGSTPATALAFVYVHHRVPLRPVLANVLDSLFDLGLFLFRLIWATRARGAKSGAFDESSSPLLVWERTGCLFWRRRAGFWIPVLGEGDILLVLSWCWRTGGRGLSLVDLWCALAVAIGALVVDTRSANSFLVPAYLGLGVPPLLVSGCYGFVASTFPHVAAPPPRLWYEGMKEGSSGEREGEYLFNGCSPPRP
jgi:hypothetical protein